MTTIPPLFSLSTPSLHASNQLAAQLLAYTVHQLFPSALIVGGGEHALGFYYDFIFEQPLTPSLLEWIEIHLRTLIKEDRSFRFHSMMRENAQTLFDYRKQPFQAALVGEHPANIVELIQIDEDYFLCPELHCVSTQEAGTIKLLSYQKHLVQFDEDSVDVMRLIGVSQPSGKELKHFLKEHDRLAKKSNHLLLGTQQGLFTCIDSLGLFGCTWKAKGLFVLETLQTWLQQCKPWKEEKTLTPAVMIGQGGVSFLCDHQDYQLIPSPLKGHLALLCQTTLDDTQLPHRLNEFSTVYCYCPEPQSVGLLGSSVHWVDFTTILCSISQVMDELISSL